MLANNRQNNLQQKQEISNLTIKYDQLPIQSFKYQDIHNNNFADSYKSNKSNKSQFNKIKFHIKQMNKNFKQNQLQIIKNQNKTQQYKKQIQPSSSSYYLSNNNYQNINRKSSLDSQPSLIFSEKFSQIQNKKEKIIRIKKQRKSKTVNSIEIIQLNQSPNQNNKQIQEKFGLKIFSEQSQKGKAKKNQAFYDQLTISKLDINIENLQNLSKNNQKRVKTQQFNQTISRFNQQTIQKPKQNVSKAVNKFVKIKTRQSFSRTFSHLMNQNERKNSQQHQNQIMHFNKYQKKTKNQERDINITRLYNKNLENIIKEDKQRIFDDSDKRENLKKIFNYNYMNSFLKDCKKQTEKVKTKSFYSFLQKQPIFRNQIICKIQEMNSSNQEKITEKSPKYKIKRMRTPASLSLKKKYESNLVDKQKSLDISLLYSKTNPFIMIDHLTPFSKQKKRNNVMNYSNTFSSNKKNKDISFNNINYTDKQLCKAVRLINNNYNCDYKSKRSKTQWFLSAWDENQNTFNQQENNQLQF